MPQPDMTAALGDTAAPARRATAATTAEKLFLLLILVIPVAASPPMQAHIVELPGAKLANIVAAAFALSVLFNPARLFRISGRLERNALIAFFAYLTVFIVAFARSVPNIARLHGMAEDVFPASAAEYALSGLVVPVIFASTFVYVLKYMRTRESIARLLQAIGVSIFILSCVVIAAAASRPDAFNDPTRDAVAALTSDVLGLHYNSIGTMYIVAAPILLYLALKRGGFWTVNYFVALLAVILLESRTALFIIVAMSAVTLIALGRGRTLLAIAPLVAVAAAVVAGTLLVQLLTIGFTEHSGLSFTRFLSGRDEKIWLPLMIEWWSNPQRFWFGAGEYGVLSSFMLFSGVIPPVAHSHNAYLDFFLDNGIVLEFALLGGITAVIRWGWRTARRIKTPLFWVLFLCGVSFLIAGLTGRHFYPNQEDTFLFPIFALMINVLRLGAPEKAGNARAPASPRFLAAPAAG
jgi:hypothetical protein